MEAPQLQLFKDITLEYFAKLTPDRAPSLGDAYLQFGDPVLLDYASMVRIRGQYDGCIYLTSPTSMLEHLLAAHGEPEVSSRTLRDMCRELSNVLAGNASKAFGGHWTISVPESISGENGWNGTALPDSTFVMPIQWNGSESLLVVGLEAPKGHST